MTAAATTSTTTEPTRAEPGPPRLRPRHYEPEADVAARHTPATAPAERPNLVVVDLSDSSELRRRIAGVLRLAL